MLGTEQAPNADKEIDRKKSDGSYELTDAERKEKKRRRQAKGNAYINLQLSCEELSYDLVSLARTEELPDGCARDAWERITVNMTSLKVKTRSPCCQCFNKINWRMSEPILQFG